MFLNSSRLRSGSLSLQKAFFKTKPNGNRRKKRKEATTLHQEMKHEEKNTQEQILLLPPFIEKIYTRVSGKLKKYMPCTLESVSAGEIQEIQKDPHPQPQKHHRRRRASTASLKVTYKAIKVKYTSFLFVIKS